MNTNIAQERLPYIGWMNSEECDVDRVQIFSPEVTLEHGQQPNFLVSSGVAPHPRGAFLRSRGVVPQKDEAGLNPLFLLILLLPFILHSYG